MRKKNRNISFAVGVVLAAGLLCFGSTVYAEENHRSREFSGAERGEEGQAEEETKREKTADVPVKKTETNAKTPELEQKHAAPETQTDLPKSWQIGEFPIILQNPELPTGCEITALAMVMDYYGFEVDKITLAERYLPKAEAELSYGEDGRLYGPDLNQYFIGDPFQHGLVCGTQAIVTAADTYLEETGSNYRAEDLSGTSPEELYELVAQDIPVVVWVTIYMEDREEPQQGWYTENGTYVDWSHNDHGAVLIGYTDKTVSIADPISGLMEYSKEQFELVYQSRESRSVILREDTDTK